MVDPRDVFISHSSTDKSIARELRLDCEAAGLTCWMAPDDVRGAGSWAEQILAAVNGCRALVVLVSARANASQHVSREVNLALARGKPILPVRIESVRPEGALEYLLSLVQRVDAFPPPFAQHLPTIGHHLAALLSRPPPVAAAPPSQPEEQPGMATPHNLPVELSSFVGRASELHDLVQRLPATRLLTLTGPGGTGKTRLAMQAALQVTSQFPDGVFLVELASVTDRALMPSQIASVLGVPESQGQPIEESLAQYLASRHLLLVLDNLEQIPDVGAFVGRLLARCGSVHILATSRVPLHVRGEAEYTVSPLGLPDQGAPQTAERVAQSEAVMLFAARAVGIRSDFLVTDRNAPEVAAICARVDGLPLAIELAAARVKLLSPGQILSRLNDRLDLLTGGARDLPERQQTLRATIAWSHELLAAPEQVLFRRLAVFDDGLTFAAAEAICLDGSGDSLLETMSTLVDGSLARAIGMTEDEPRFAMLETIREYAADQLAASGEQPDIKRRHFEFFFDLARRFEAELGSGELTPWLHRLDADRANLAGAMDWGLDAGDIGRVAEFFEFLRDYTRARGRTAEARSLVATLLEHANLADATRGRLLHEAAVLAVRQGDWEAVDRLAAGALALARRLGDFRGATGAGQLLAISAGERGDVAGEAEIIGEMLEDAGRCGDPRMEVLARSHVALRSLRLGEFEEAADKYNEILGLMQGVGVMRESVGACFLNRGLAELHAGRLDKATLSLAESAAIARSMETPDLIGYVLEGYAAFAAAVGQPAPAARLQGASATALAVSDSALEAFEVQMSSRTAAYARTALGAATYEAERSAGAAMLSRDAIDFALTIGTGRS